MTAQAAENAQAAAAVAAGEAASTKHHVDAEAQHRISGSTVAVEPASTPDDHAVGWFGSNVTPGRVSPQPDGRPNDVAVSDVTRPHDL
jgi:hypothetical protein